VRTATPAPSCGKGPAARPTQRTELLAPRESGNGQVARRRPVWTLCGINWRQSAARIETLLRGAMREEIGTVSWS
jgi:hypothetical protein